jgi:hypothetical protein
MTYKNVIDLRANVVAVGNDVRLYGVIRLGGTVRSPAPRKVSGIYRFFEILGAEGHLDGEFCYGTEKVFEVFYNARADLGKFTPEKGVNSRASSQMGHFLIPIRELKIQGFMAGSVDELVSLADEPFLRILTSGFYKLKVDRDSNALNAALSKYPPKLTEEAQKNGIYFRGDTQKLNRSGGERVEMDISLVDEQLGVFPQWVNDIVDRCRTERD